jgi:hypothetical protein
MKTFYAIMELLGIFALITLAIQNASEEPIVSAIYGCTAVWLAFKDASIYKPE